MGTEEKKNQKLEAKVQFSGALLLLIFVSDLIHNFIIPIAYQH